ncbi:hypothetical protein BS78_09G092500 [Paspalum vaginatum]|nr:hypothetical protein BS78_09G092500 [Paspalum vaginatum]
MHAKNASTQLKLMATHTSAVIVSAVSLAHLPKRYKLFVTAGDETGDTDFILFGRIAHCLIRRPADTLIADTPAGFIPDAITKLLEKTFIWNVSFTENTIASGNVCFQVNAIIER